MAQVQQLVGDEVVKQFVGDEVVQQLSGEVSDQAGESLSHRACPSNR